MYSFVLSHVTPDDFCIVPGAVNLLECSIGRAYIFLLETPPCLQMCLTRCLMATMRFRTAVTTSIFPGLRQAAWACLCSYWFRFMLLCFVLLWFHARLLFHAGATLGWR